MNFPNKNLENNDNVVQINKNIDEKHLQNAKDSIEMIQKVKKEHSDEITEFIMESTLNLIKQQGALIDPKRINIKDIHILEQAIESLLYRYNGIEHPLQPVVDELFSLEDEEEETDE